MRHSIYAGAMGNRCVLNFHGLSPIHLNTPSIYASPDLIKDDAPHATYVRLLLSCLVRETAIAG